MILETILPTISPYILYLTLISKGIGIYTPISARKKRKVCKKHCDQKRETNPAMASAVNTVFMRVKKHSLLKDVYIPILNKCVLGLMVTDLHM